MYIRNASLWLDLRISMMTLQLLSKSHVSSAETAADAEQVQSRNIGLEDSFTAPRRVAGEKYR